MKKVVLFALLLLSHAWANAQIITVKDSISTDTHWTSNHQYLLQGFVYVTSGATLTIDSGTIIKGDKNSKGTLIIERGAKIKANGTVNHPIVFTSNQPAGSRSYGDWGGVVLCGKAPTNWTGGQSQVEGGPRSLYGGTDAHDNSGNLNYVRIEFPGVALSPNNEINGLTLCSVGDATVIDHIQVSYSGDDAVEWFGGNVNTKYVVAYRTWDDDFDTDNGYQGKNQFMFAVRDPYAADNSGSKSFESDSYMPTGTDTVNLTKPVFSNCTIIGPLLSPTSTAYDPYFVSAAHIRRGSAISILNSILLGFPAGILIDESVATIPGTTANIRSGELQIRNTIVGGNANNKNLFYVKDGARSLTPTTTWADTVTNSPFGTFNGPISWFNTPSFGNKTYTNSSDVRLQNPFNLANPNPVPTSTSPVAYNTNTKLPVFNPNKALNLDTTGNYANYNAPTVYPDFTNTKASDAFFTKVNHIGAFSGTQTTADNWMATWTNFDPVNTDYTYNPTGVNKVELAIKSVSVYPNPASNRAILMFDLKETTNINVVISDITGKIVSTVFNGTKTNGSQMMNIDLSNLNAGFYFVTISTNEGSKNVKLSVIK